MIAEYSLGAGIVYWLYRSNVLDIRPLQAITLSLAAKGLLLAFAMVYLSSLRLQWLLRDQHIHISVFRCFVFNCLGIFYSLFLPGGVSGDAAKAYYLLRHVEVGKTALLGSLILDRLLGMLAMIGLGLVSSVFIVASKQELLPYFAAFTAIFVLIAALLWILLKTEVGVISDKHNSPISRVYVAFRNLLARLRLSQYSSHTLVIASILSVLIHGLAILLIYLCSVHSQSNLDFMAVFSVGPFGLLANAIPISPGGLGVGEQSFEFLYKLVGGANGASSFLASRLFLYSPAMIGGLFAAFLFLRLHRIGFIKNFFRPKKT